jgi:hypothetical protein
VSTCIPSPHKTKPRAAMSSTHGTSLTWCLLRYLHALMLMLASETLQETEETRARASADGFVEAVHVITYVVA